LYFRCPTKPRGFARPVNFAAKARLVTPNKPSFMASPLIPADLVAQLESSLSQADDAQRAMMEERVILTDYYENPTGSGSKTESASSTYLLIP